MLPQVFKCSEDFEESCVFGGGGRLQRVLFWQLGEWGKYTGLDLTIQLQGLS